MAMVIGYGLQANVLEQLPQHIVDNYEVRMDKLADARNYHLALINSPFETCERICHILKERFPSLPILCFANSSELEKYSASKEMDDFILNTATERELQTRVKRLVSRPKPQFEPEIPSKTSSSAQQGAEIIEGLHFLPSGYGVKANDKIIDFAYMEFELFRTLCSKPGYIFKRDELMHKVWGYKYFGGSRTVDVHIRKIRAKLGPELQGLIQTVRNSGYKFEPSRRGS